MTDVEIAYNPDQVLNKLQVQRTKVDSFLDVRPAESMAMFVSMPTVQHLCSAEYCYFA